MRGAHGVDFLFDVLGTGDKDVLRGFDGDDFLNAQDGDAFDKLVGATAPTVAPPTPARL